MRTSRPLVFRSVILVLLVKGAGSLTNQYHVLVEYKVLACTLVVDGAYSTVGTWYHPRLRRLLYFNN